MDEIICYTNYVPYGEGHTISFMELLLDDNWANGRIECPEKVYADIGGKNHKLTAKQDYEFLLRAVRKYQLKAVGIIEEDSSVNICHRVWDEYRTDCYVFGKYQKELMASGYYSDALKSLMAKALELPEPNKGIAWLKKMIANAPEYYEIDDNTRPILIYRDNDFCHHVPASFVEGLAQALRMCRQRVVLFDVTEDGCALKQFEGKRFKAIIGIQTRVFLSTVQDGFFYDLVGGPKYNIILDHPISVRNLFENHPENYYAMVHDRNYQAFIKRYWPRIKDCFCFPPGGSGTFSGQLKKELGDKKYDVIFIGSYFDYRTYLAFLYSHLNGSYRVLGARFLHIMRRNPDYLAEKALWKVLEYYDIKASDTDFLNLFEMLRYVVGCISGYYREKVICTLLDAGIEIHVYGESWDKAFFAEHKCLIRHPGINVEDSLHIMEQAKISLNIMSWHKDGFTERVLNSMLAKAVVVSDKSTRLEEEFVDGEDIILFNLAQINELPRRVKALLQDGERLKRIAESGAKKVIEKHLWIHRAKELLNIISAERPNT